MIVQLDTHRLQTLGQVREFLDGSQEIDLRPQTRTEAYAFVAETVQRFDYAGRSKADKGLLHRFLTKATDLSRAQVTRLLRQYRTTGEVIDRRGAPRQPFPRRYTPTDIGRLAELDALHGTLSGPTTRKLCARAFHRFGDPRFERLAAISNGHLYNLRHSITYQRRRGTVPAPTRSVQIAIGERRRPQPFGQPGHVRVDTVHQGDLDGVKGLYHLNLVDEVTQFQFIGSVEYIQAACLKPVLEALLRAFPFILHGFHADNGSEFINRDVAALLEAMHIDAFTKSRARRCTDNALVESKNGSVIRKHLGYGHIPNRYAERVHAFNQQFLSPYLNFHRPCFFPSEEVDAKGRVRKRYRDADIMTPYEKLKSLPNAAACLKPGTTFAELDAAASATSDNEAHAPSTRLATACLPPSTRQPDNATTHQPMRTAWRSVTRSRRAAGWRVGAE